MQYRLTRKDLSLLLSLLLRLILRKEKSGGRRCFGQFEKADHGDKELADILVNGVTGEQEGEYLTPDQVRRVPKLLVSVTQVLRV